MGEFQSFKIFYRLNYSGFYFVYYHGSVATVLELHFSQLLLSKAYFKVRFEVQKVWQHFFHVNLYYYSVPNDVCVCIQTYGYIKVL